MKKVKLRESILFLLLSIALFGLGIFLIYKAFFAEWGSLFLIFIALILVMLSIKCFIEGFLGSLPTKKNIKKWEDIEKNKPNESSLNFKINTSTATSWGSKKRSDDDEWNRLDELYDEHYPPGFDPF
jgi:hypothetical protein